MNEIDRRKVLVHAEYNRDWYAYKLATLQTYTIEEQNKNINRNMDSRGEKFWNLRPNYQRHRLRKVSRLYFRYVIRLISRKYIL